MTLDEQLALVVAVGRAFVRLEMGRHAQILRDAYRSLRAGQGWPGPQDEAWLIDWARTLQVPPYDGERGYPVIERGRTPCGHHPGLNTTTRAWTRGWRTRCRECGVEWVVIDGAQ